MNENFSEERLVAFVDHELDAAESDEIYAAIAQDAALARRVCELRAAKEMLRHAYDRKQIPAQPGPHRTAKAWNMAIAASIALLVGMMIGWKAHGANADSPMAWLQAMFAEQPARILIHLDNASIDRMEETLDLAEAYLAKVGRANVEVVVNNSGINLLRTETTPYADRIAALSSQHELLSFVACGYAVSRYRKAGEPVTLLPNAKLAGSAIEHVVDRVRQGWTYVKI